MAIAELSEIEPRSEIETNISDQESTTGRSPNYSPPDNETLVYQSEIVWSAERPDSLVVCCSDGRLQMSIDDFLHEHLGIFYYDRLYAPGGPGALSDVGSQLMRTDHYRTDLQLLLKAHSFSQVILIFHGAAIDGPSDSMCAYYRKMMPDSSREEILERQHQDMEDVSNYLHGLRANLEIKAFRAEATSEKHLRFVRL
jgi:hypothetical protein